MNTPLIAISNRGQITIPYRIRKEVTVKYFLCQRKGKKIILEPVQTRDEFLTELDTREAEWGEKGGKTISDIKKKYKL